MSIQGNLLKINAVQAFVTQDYRDGLQGRLIYSRQTEEKDRK